MWEIVKPVSVQDSVLTVRPTVASPVSQIQIRLFDTNGAQNPLTFTFEDITTEYSLDLFPSLVMSGFIEVGTSIVLYELHSGAYTEVDRAVVTA